MPAQKFTPLLFSQILAALTLGSSRDVAARGVGISVRTLDTWMRDDADVMEQVVKAEAACELRDLAVIDRAITEYDEDPKLAVGTAKWRRERLNPARWAPATRNDLFIREQQIREFVAELNREGIQVTEAMFEKELEEVEKRALPPASRKH